MIGEIVHYTGTNNLPSGRAVCYPATVLGELPNQKLDLLIFKPNVPALTKIAVEPGLVRAAYHWHKLHGDAIA